jgi:HK97 family phage major capsid protein
MPNLIELQTKRTKLMNDATKLIQGDNVTAEKRTNFDTMMAEVDVLEADIDRVKRTAAFEEELRNDAGARIPRGTPGASMDSAENVQIEKRALRDFLVSGKQSETRDLGVGPVAGNITGGAALVAPAFYPILTQSMLAWGGVVNIVNQKTTDTGASMKISLVNDTTNGLSDWPESTPVNEVDPALATAQSETSMYNTGALLVTLEELQDSAFDIDAFIQNVFGQRLYRGLARYVSQGSTSGAFVPYSAGAVSAGASAAGTAISYSDILQLWGAIDPAYEPTSTFVMNSQTRAKIMSVTDTTGKPLFVPSALTNGAFDTLLGKSVVLDQYLPNVGLGSRSLYFGDFRAGYTLRNVGQFTIARDPYTYLFSKGSIGFLGYGRGGSFSTNAGGTNAPIKYLTQKAS